MYILCRPFGIQLPHPAGRKRGLGMVGMSTGSSRLITRVVVVMVTRLLQLILKIKSFFGGCSPARGVIRTGLLSAAGSD